MNKFNIMVRTHNDLDVWKRSIAFVTEVYAATAIFPKHEIYGLASQIRRAAVSIPSNIAEGATRRHKTGFKQFLYIALSSAAEIDTQSIKANYLNFIENENFEKLRGELNTISKMIQGLLKSLSL